MPHMNCWEFMECQREPGGIKSSELGVCPAACKCEYNGINKGKNGGRICWEVAGTMSGKEVKGTFALKFHDCPVCPFFSLVKAEEDTEFVRKSTVKGTDSNP